MSATLIIAIVDNLYVVDTIWHKIAKQFVISLCRKLKLSIVEFKAVVVAGNKMYRTLALCLLVEPGIRHTIDCCGVANLLKEGA